MSKLVGSTKLFNTFSTFPDVDRPRQRGLSRLKTNDRFQMYNRIESTSINMVSAASDGDVASANVKQLARTVVSTLLIIAIDVGFRRYFKQSNIAFPSSLAACGALFATMIMVHVILPGVGESIYGLLDPGANALTKFLPVFFVPSLVLLPLAEPLESYMEVK